MKRLKDWWMWYTGRTAAVPALDTVKTPVPFRAWKVRRPLLLVLNGGIR